MAAALPVSLVHAAPIIPLELPRYDGMPGDPTKPVQVYILAGQSNMVGFGHLNNSRPLYPSLFLSADPAVIPGTMPIGGSALAAHGVYQSTARDAQPGATVALHKGAFNSEADYAKLTPAKTATVALGTVTENLPTIDGPHTPVATAFIDVPKTGTYTLHAGFGDSTHAIITLDGKEVYRKEPGGRPVIEKSELEAGKQYPVSITYMKSGSAAFWMEQVDLVGTGDLMSYINQGKHTYLIEPDGGWVARNDVIFKEARLKPDSAAVPLSATSNGSMFGPELGFGFVMGAFHDEPVLLIKTAQGNRSLGFDFRPPSSGREHPDSEYESAEYRLMIEGVRKTLSQIADIIPGYQEGQGYEIAGFAWWQGHKDAGASKEEYEKHLVNLINDIRKEFNAPKMRAVVATVGFDGYRINENYQKIWAAQMAVGDPAQHPQFKGNVASVDALDFWRDVEEAPQPQGHHYNRSAATYLLTGEALGRAMVELLGGKAEPIPKSDREERTTARIAAEAAKPVPTDEQKAASAAAIKPMLLDGALVSFTTDPRQWTAIEASIQGKPPARPPSLLDDTLDTAASYFRHAGISDYEWKPFGDDMRGAEWQYKPIDVADSSKGIEDLAALAPAGMENWFAPSFDAKKAGWKNGAAPFGGNRNNADAQPRPDWYGGPARPTAATAFDNDGVLLRQTFDLPALKDGHRYRIRVAGSVRANSGDGFAIYVNGKLLTDVRSGITAWRREGGRPRGSHVWADFREEFQGGKVTLAVAGFPMNNRGKASFIPARDPLSVWIEEMKLPPLVGPAE